MGNGRPGREIPKEYREIVAHLVDTQGWRYDKQRSGHPMLYPPESDKKAFPVPTTPGDQRSLRKFAAQVRRAGGLWPPGRRR